MAPGSRFLTLRRCWWLIAAAWLAVAVYGTAPAAAAEGCSLRVGWETYAMYTFADEDGQVTGADAELVRALAKHAECSVSFVELPWSRIVLEIQRGTLDVTTSASRTKEREAFARFSQSYRETEIGLFVRREDPVSARLPSLAAVPRHDFRLGIIADYYYGPEFEQLSTEPNFMAQVDAAPDYPTNINKLLMGRIDGFLVDDIGVMAAELSKRGAADRIVRHDIPLAGNPLHLMFSRASVDEAVVRSFDAEIDRMRTDGRLDAILNRFTR